MLTAVDRSHKDSSHELCHSILRAGNGLQVIDWQSHASNKRHSQQPSIVRNLGFLEGDLRFLEHVE
jgi:hypothetical protein